MEVIPELIHFTKENSKDFALYYYNFPLSIHKGADTLVKAMIKAKQDGVKDITLKVYEEVFELEKTDEQSVLDTFNKAIGTKYTLAQIDTKEIRAILEQDIQKAKDILVKGTPTLFINGKRDMSKKAYKDMVK
jgi:protein-disulfide isomerase